MPYSQSWMFDNKTRWRINFEKQTEIENVTEILTNQKQLVSFVSFQLCWMFRVRIPLSWARSELQFNFEVIAINVSILYVYIYILVLRFDFQ